MSYAPAWSGRQGLRLVRLNCIFEVIGLREDRLREIRDENTLLFKELCCRGSREMPLLISGVRFLLLEFVPANT